MIFTTEYETASKDFQTDLGHGPTQQFKIEQ